MHIHDMYMYIEKVLFFLVQGVFFSNFMQSWSPTFISSLNKNGVPVNWETEKNEKKRKETERKETKRKQGEKQRKETKRKETKTK